MTFSNVHSEYNRSMANYEARCREANASNGEARTRRRASIEDSLVKEGLEAVESYEKTLRKRWKNARCLAEYDGISMGFSIAARARKRLENIPTTYPE